MDVSIYEEYTGSSLGIVRQLNCIKESVSVNNVIVKVPLIPNFNTSENVKQSVKALSGMGFPHIKEISSMDHITKK